MSIFMRMVGNPFMKAILRSPVHPLLSKSTAVVSVTGRKSGKVFSFPVNYQREGEIVWIVSMRDRSWWKNLRGGAKVTVRLAGEEYEGRGEVFETKSEVEDNLREYLRVEPDFAKYFNVGVDSEGRLVPEDIAKAAQGRVMVRVILS
jgi:deazaflavin-dependent oxidoreductase (nitroreductase family)